MDRIIYTDHFAIDLDKLHIHITHIIPTYVHYYGI